ncbi:MAG: glycosyltransferase family 2 protein [bacterium]
MISIVTPSFNQLSYLQRCCASVADQQFPHEHIIMDGGSTDGTVEWLKGQTGLRWISEPDRGMYDAINKGIAMAKGDIMAYLNCDEQYLPDTLAAVEAAFLRYPKTDIVYGDTLLIRPDGTLASFRKAYPLRWSYVASSHLYVLSCATFYRKALLERCGGYDTSWRTVGDADLMLRSLRAGAGSVRLPLYLSVFTLWGGNLGSSSQAEAEMSQLSRRAPVWVRVLRPVLNIGRLTEKVLSGAFRQSWPLIYAVYTDAFSGRTRITAQSGTFHWPR